MVYSHCYPNNIGGAGLAQSVPRIDFFSEIGGEKSHKKKDMEKHGTCVVFISRDMCHLFEH